MDALEQIESDLRSIANSQLPANIKKAIDQTIYHLRTSSNESIEISNSNDSLVIIFEELSKQKKYLNETIIILPAIRILVENGWLIGQACNKIFSIITTDLKTFPDSFAFKILQIALSAFSSPYEDLNMRYSAIKWVFMIAGQSSDKEQIAIATAFQIFDVIFDEIIIKRKPSRLTPPNSPSQQSNDDNQEDPNEEGSSDSDGSNFTSSSQNINTKKTADPNHWTVVFSFALIKDILACLNDKAQVTFKGFFSKTNYSTKLLKYILDRHFQLLSSYQPQYSDLLKGLWDYTQMQTDPSHFSIFAPHLVLYLPEQECKTQIQAVMQKLLSFVQSSPHILNVIAAIVLANPNLQFTLIPEEELLRLSQYSNSIFLKYFKGTLSEPIKIFGSNRPSLSQLDTFDTTANKLLVSSVSFIYSQIPLCYKYPNHFTNLFSLFETVWQRIMQTTENTMTLGTSLKASRICVRLALNLKQSDPAQRIFSTLCGIAIPSSSECPLTSKGVVALHSIIRLLLQLKGNLVTFWPLIFETISKCHHTASHKRSSADSHALRLISPSLASFTPQLEDEQFVALFKVVMKLSVEEIKSYFDRGRNVPNFWPVKTLCYVFCLNVTRTKSIETKYFEHLKFIMQCDSAEWRVQATNSLFEIAKEAINKSNSLVCRQLVFDLINQATTSNYRDVSVTSFNMMLNFLAGGTSQYINEGWPMILTILKVVWASPFTENIQNGFKALTFICCDCMMFLKSTDIEICLSTISTYISQTEDMNIALGSIGLLWNIGSGLTADEPEIWRILFKMLHKSFTDPRQNIRHSSLQTFFNLVTFHLQFPAELRSYLLESVIKPLLSTLQNNSESSILALQGITQCLRSLGNYKPVIPDLIQSIEAISLDEDDIVKSGSAAFCLVPLFFFEDLDLARKATECLLRITQIYVKKPPTFDLQRSVSIITEVLPSIASKIDEEHFSLWLVIIKLYSTVQLDKPFLHVSTHAAMNVLVSLPGINEKRRLDIVQLLITLIELKSPPLMSKSFDILTNIFIKDFNEEGRSKCLQLILPLYQRMLVNPECADSFAKLMEAPLDLNILLKCDFTVYQLVDVGRRNERFRYMITDLIAQKMNLMSKKMLPVFLSLGKQSPVLYTWFFKDFCCGNETVEFARETRDYVFAEIMKTVELIIGEEKALDSVIRQDRYRGMITFLEEFTKMRTNGEIFQTKSDIGHLKFIMKPLIMLVETKCDELQKVVKNILYTLDSEVHKLFIV